MRYSKPELVVLGAATTVVQGMCCGQMDNETSETSKPAIGIGLGLEE